LGFRIAEAVRAEMGFNASGADRKIEDCQKDGGKQVTETHESGHDDQKRV